MKSVRQNIGTVIMNYTNVNYENYAIKHTVKTDRDQKIRFL